MTTDIDDGPDRLGKAIFSIRWGLVPMYLMMWAPIAGFCVWMAQEVIAFWWEFDWPGQAVSSNSFHLVTLGKLSVQLLLHNRESFILWSLGMLDATLVASLLVLSTLGGYKIFVHEFDFTRIPGIPKWYAELNAISLKEKLPLSLLGVTAVAILRMGMEYNRGVDRLIEENQHNAALVAHLMTTNTLIQGGVHILFVGTLLGVAIYGRYLHAHSSTASPEGHH